MTKDTATDPQTIPASLMTLVVSAALFLRVLVGYQPHSGQDNHHGSKIAYGGDYEAQRHWMELTWNLPIGEWYWYDLQYWGLDYPPLTAYVSYICGAFSEWMVGPHTVALYSSRGYEGDPTHKSFMRATVWILDLLVYFPAAFCILKVLWRSRRQKPNAPRLFHEYNLSATYLLALFQPAIVLIDHGHFQYNTVALGLALWSFYFLTHPNFYLNCIWGSIFFCGALNFKQMTLYYAPAIFAYLLGRCFVPMTAGQDGNSQRCLERFMALGVTVIVCFSLMLWPFLAFGPSHEDVESMSMLDVVLNRGKHVLIRIFPLERGLFEGKVANLWCALDTKPVNIRDRIPTDVQPLAALGLTFSLMLPSCVLLFIVGKRAEPKHSTTFTRQHASDLIALLWGTTSCALAFFLASFQVHEKSILLALAPASLLAWNDNQFCDWFAIAASWTMWPLLVVDRLQVAYTCTILIFAVAAFLLRKENSAEEEEHSWISLGWRLLFRMSFAGMLGLHGLEMIVSVPAHLPDLFPVLWSVAGCALCCLAWLRATWCLFARVRELGLKEKDD